MDLKKIDRQALNDRIAAIEDVGAVAKMGCRRSHRTAETVGEGITWGLNLGKNQAALEAVRPVLTKLYAAKAHLRGRIHRANGNESLAPRVDFLGKRLPLEDQPPSFRAAFAAQAVFVADVLDEFLVPADPSPFQEAAVEADATVAA